MNDERLQQLPRAEVIRASAGSGKTYVLVQRYIALLFRQASPASILASTFTVKAAGEILTRVLARLARCIISEGERALLAKEIGIPQEHIALEVKNIFARTLRELPQAAVCTLDAFVARIAGGLPFACELPPGWQLADLGGMSRELERLLVGQFSRELGAMLSLVANQDASRAVAQPLIALCSRFHEELQVLGPQAFDLDSFRAEQHLSIPSTAQLLPEAIRLSEAIAQLEPPKTKKGEPSKTAISLLAKVSSGLAAGDFASLFAGEAMGRFWNAVQSGASEVKYSTIIFSREQYRPLFDAARFLATVEFGRLCDRSRVLLAVLAQFDELYRAEMQLTGRVRHHDLLLGVARFMASDSLGDVAFALNQRFAHVLLDEFQDTSPLQWAVLRPLVDEILSDDTTPRSVMIVGDQKQAIYGWRGGDAAIFEQAVSSAATWSAREMTESFRSSQVVLTFVNSVVAGLAAASDRVSPPSLASSIQKFSALYSEHRAHRTALTGRVTVTAASSTEGDSSISREQWLLTKLHAIRRDLPNSTIGILTRKNETVVQIVTLLRSHGFAVSGDGRAGAMRTRIVEGVRMALYATLHPGDSASRFGAIACGLAEDERDLDELLDDCSWRKLLQRMIALSLSPTLTEQERSDVASATWLVSDSIERGRDARELRELLAVQPLSSSAAQISVLTMHRAKGLEFDAVLLPELDTKLIRSVNPDMLRWRRADGRSVVMPFVNRQLRALHPDFERADAEMQTAEYYEALCLLYVALTRAIHELHLWGEPKEREEKEAPAASAQVELEPRSMFDLVLTALQIAPHKLIAGGEIFHQTSAMVQNGRER